MLTCEWSENLEILRESGSLANGTPLLGAGGLPELIWSSWCFQLPCHHLSHACDSARRGMGSQGQHWAGASGEKFQLKDLNLAWRECGSRGEETRTGRLFLGRL